MKLNIRRWVPRTVVLGMMCGMILANPPPAFAPPPPAIDISDHQGQGSNLTYSNGNVTTYSEGDSINFRFKLEASNASGGVNGTMKIEFTGQETQCLFFEQSFSLGTHDSTNLPVEPAGGATVTEGTLLQGTGPDADEWIQTLNVSFTGDGEVTVYYFLTLSDEAGDCTGSSQHSRMGAVTGDFKNPGARNVPVPANQIIELPQITVIKMIDRDGDGSFEDTADAGEYCFRLDGVPPCVNTDASGQVVFTSVTPDGDHDITEEQLDFSQGTYEFKSGSGPNCAFSGGAAVATVASGTPPADATCTFNNGPPPLVPPTLDFGDAPGPTYPTLLANDGARHLAVGPMLGAARDAEADGQPNATATGDDAAGIDDEDGVSIPASVTSGAGAVFTVTSSDAALLDGWVDWNGDGDWTDPGEQIMTAVAVVAGANLIPVAVPAGLPDTETFARFRLSSAGGLSPIGAAVDGEVEDYAVSILRSPGSGGGGGGVGGTGGGGGGGDAAAAATERCLNLVATIVGPPGDTVIVGTPGNDVIVDLKGNNTVRGGGGDDIICTGPGNDDVATANGNDLVIDLGGVNRIHVAGGNDTIDARGDNVIFSGPGADRIKVYDGKNRIRTYSGGDVVRAGNGNNFIRTGGGRDRVFTGNGDNDIGTHHGRDRVRTGSGDDFIRLNKGNDVGRAGSGDNTIRGGKKHDLLISRGGDDLLNGMNGTDTCRPGGGKNTLINCEK